METAPEPAWNVSLKLLRLPACDGIKCECKIADASRGACFLWSRVLLWCFCGGDCCDFVMIFLASIAIVIVCGLVIYNLIGLIS